MKPNPNLVEDYLHRVLTCVEFIEQCNANLKGRDPLYGFLGVCDWVTELHRIFEELFMSKARDIVAGWPRGRSTTVSYHNRTWEWFDEWPMVSRISLEMYQQLEADRLYHQAQQRMVNEWLARYRLGDEQFQPEVTYAIRGVEWFIGEKLYDPLP